MAASKLRVPPQTPVKEQMKTAHMTISAITATLALVVLTAVTTPAQTAANGPMNSAEIDRIIQAFTAKEIQFRRALNSYSFKRDALVQKIGMGGQVTGEYHRVSMFTF